MARSWWSDDDQLLAELDRALNDPPPPEFMAAGKAAFAWRDIDAELAALVYDSRHEPVLTRTSDTAALRAMTFASPRLTVELEITPEGLRGQLVPPGRAEIEIQLREDEGSGREPVRIEADEVGCFAIRPAPAEPFRLRCRAGDSIDILTSWIHL